MNQTQSHWDAQLYDQKHSFVFKYGEGLMELLSPKKNERILDVGCGTGKLTHKISELADGVVGIDSSEQMIKVAKSNYPNIDFRMEDAANFQFDEPFDSIFSNATLHWVTNYTGAIDSMYQNLKKGGKIVLEFGGRGNVQSIESKLRKSLKSRGYSDQSNLELWFFPSISEYTSALEKRGFEVTFAILFNRPTPLVDEEKGIVDWLSMFGNSFFKNVSDSHVEEIKLEVQEKLRPKLYCNGQWHADYKRIRIVAHR